MIEMPEPAAVARSLGADSRYGLTTAILTFDGYIVHPDLLGDLRDQGLVEVRGFHLGAFGMAVRKIIMEGHV